MRVKNDEVLTLKQAAERLELSPTTLRFQVHAGKLRATRAGTLFLVTATEVERYRREHKGKVGPIPKKK